VKRRTAIRLVLTLTVTGLALAYIFWKIDVGKTLHILANANPWYFLLSVGIAFLTVPPMAWRWQLLLKAKGINDNVGWLTRAYFVSYSASQMLPTSVGGDAVRIYETAKRHPGRGGPVAGSIILERALGGAATLILAAIGIALAYGNYDIGIYLWVEVAFVVLTVIAGIVLFSKSVRPLLRRFVPILKRLWVERHVRAVYEGIHSYRHNVKLLLFVTGVTLLLQAARVVSIWAGGEAVGVDLSIRAVHAQRRRRARVVLRQLPRQARRQRGRGVRRRLRLLPRHDRACPPRSGDLRVRGDSPRRGARRRGPRRRIPALTRSDVTIVAVTFNGVPWIEPCLESVRDYPTIVVDHGSTDGTPALVRERFPEATLIQQQNKGLGAGFNRGMREAPDSRYYLLINSDAWVVGDAVERLAAFADENPRVAVVGPRLRYPDGSLQRSVRGFPTLWRLATEYLFLRKLAPRSRALNAFYAGDFEHDRTYAAEFLMAAVLLVRRDATDEVGLFDERYFMFSEEVDWCYRFQQKGWGVVFFPAAEAVHVGGASWKKEFDPMFLEQVRGHLRFLADHKGMREAERARLLFLAGLHLRSWFFPADRRATYRNAAEWLSSSSVRSLLQSER
jgi:GT2 family glycosyltransferase/uncharacterized membrane protein YbhN (UPF0104 family)